MPKIFSRKQIEHVYFNKHPEQAIAKDSNFNYEKYNAFLNQICKTMNDMIIKQVFGEEAVEIPFNVGHKFTVPPEYLTYRDKPPYLEQDVRRILLKAGHTCFSVYVTEKDKLIVDFYVLNGPEDPGSKF